MGVTTILIVVTAIISIYAWSNYGLMERWILNPYRAVYKGQYYRLLTSGFLHADWGHLIFNMISFYFFGGLVEQIFGALFGNIGPLCYVGFYLLAIIVSDIPTTIKHKADPAYSSLGASGGVSAIIFAGILFQPLTSIYLFFIPIGIPGFIFGPLYLAYSYYSSRQGNSGINHDAHLYGALFGIVFMILLYPSAVPSFFEQISEWRFNP